MPNDILELEIPLALTERIREAAIRRGITPDELCAEMVRAAVTAATPPNDGPPTPRRVVVRAARDASRLRREIHHTNSRSESAARACARSHRQIDALPHARIRGLVLRRIEAHYPLSEFEQEEAHSLVCMACVVAGLEDGTRPTREQWKAIFRTVRAGLGIDRLRKRDEIAPIISLDPALLAKLNVAAAFVGPTDGEAARCALAPMIRELVRRVRASYLADKSRKRRATYRASLNVIRSICATRLGGIQSVQPLVRGSSESVVNVMSHRFREYLKLGAQSFPLAA